MFRGTQGALDWITNATLPFTLALQYAQFAVWLTGAFKNLVEGTPGATGYVFGHSLGGTMAEMFMGANPGARYEAVTFGSPGAQQLIPIADPRITNVEHSEDPVVVRVPGLEPTGVALSIELPGYWGI